MTDESAGVGMFEMLHFESFQEDFVQRQPRSLDEFQKRSAGN
jgi:hypothetical protein